MTVEESCGLVRSADIQYVLDRVGRKTGQDPDAAWDKSTRTRRPQALTDMERRELAFQEELARQRNLIVRPPVPSKQIAAA